MIIGEGDAYFATFSGTTGETANELLPLLLVIGFVVGLFFGITGGSLMVSGLILATGMPLTSAVGTSLVAVTAFWCCDGCDLCGFRSHRLARCCAHCRRWAPWRRRRHEAWQGSSRTQRSFDTIFANLVIMVAMYIVSRGFVALTAA